MTGIQKSSFTTIVINLSKNHQWILKPWMNACLAIGYFRVSKHHPTDDITDHKGEVTFADKNLIDTT